MARALTADPSTKTLSVSLSGKPSGVVTLHIRRKGHHGHHHATHTFGPLTGCHRLPSVRVFDHCHPHESCGNEPHHTPECSGRVDVPECVTCCEHGHHDAHGGHHAHGSCGHHCDHHDHHHAHHAHHAEPSVTYTASMSGCTATFTLDENIHDAPSGYYMADLFDGAVRVKRMTLVVRGTGLNANVKAPVKDC